jgi:hypothetical protein
MPDFGLTFHVREGNDSGPDVQGATVSGELVPVTGDGTVTVEDVLVSVHAPGFAAYDRQRYHRPNLQAEVPISLQRTGDSAIPRLQVVDGHFHDGSQRVHLRTVTSFLLFNRLLRGEDIAPYCQYWRDLAGTGVEFRVFLFNKSAPDAMGWPVLRPESYGDYWTVLQALPGVVAKWGHRLKLCVFTDMQDINRDQGYHNGMFDGVVGSVRDASNVRIQLGNQYIKNGYDPQAFRKPEGTGLLFSKGSTAERWMPPRNPWDWSDWDAGRTTKFTDSESLINIGNGDLDGSGTHVTGRHPCDSGEPIGFDEQDKPGSRSTNPLWAMAVRAEAEAFADAVCFHHQSGAFSQIPGPVTERCARAFFGVA